MKLILVFISLSAAILAFPGIADGQEDISGYVNGDSSLKKYIYTKMQKLDNFWSGKDMVFFAAVRFEHDSITQVTFSGEPGSMLKEGIEKMIKNTSGHWNRKPSSPSTLVLPFIFIMDNSKSQHSIKRGPDQLWKDQADDPLRYPIECILFSPFVFISYPDIS